MQILAFCAIWRHPIVPEGNPTVVKYKLISSQQFDVLKTLVFAALVFRVPLLHHPPWMTYGWDNHSECFIPMEPLKVRFVRRYIFESQSQNVKHWLFRLVTEQRTIPKRQYLKSLDWESKISFLTYWTFKFLYFLETLENERGQCFLQFRKYQVLILNDIVW